MTIAELISLSDELVDNAFSQSIKLMLVNEIEGRILHDVFRVDPDDVEPYTASDISGGTELLLGAPFLQVYVAWMKSMYYWHMAERDEYENEHAMFDNEWTRLCRTVCEAREYGTSSPPVWETILPTRYLSGRIVRNTVMYDNEEETFSSQLTFAELTETIEKGGWPVCVVSGVPGVNTVYLPMSQVASTVLTFSMAQDWLDENTREYVHAVLWFHSDGAIDWQFEES